jgi:hypothetical protein
MRFAAESGLQLLSSDFHKHTLNQDLWDVSLMRDDSNVNTSLCDVGVTREHLSRRMKREELRRWECGK